MEIKPKTVGDLRETIKDLHDDMPLYIDDESGDQVTMVLSIEEGTLEDITWGEDDEEIITETKALILGIA